MKLFPVILIFLSGILLSGNGNGVNKQLRDFRIFKKVILTKEGSLDLHQSDKEILKSMDNLELDFQSAKTDLEQFKSYAVVLAKLHCGHTQVHPNKKVYREWLAARNSLPIDMYLIGKRLYVNDLSKKDRILVNENKPIREYTKGIPDGAEIIRIDNKSISSIVNSYSKYISSDENGIDFKYHQSSHLFDFYRHLDSPFKADSILVEYIYNNDSLSVYLMPGTAPVHTMNDRMNANHDLFDKNEMNMGEFSIYGKVGYFRFKSFSASHGKRYDAFLQRSFERIHKKKIKKLVVDLRGNTGGVMQYDLMGYFVGDGVHLGKYIVKKPKSFFDNPHIKRLTKEYVNHKRTSKEQKKAIRKRRFIDGNVVSKLAFDHLKYDGEVVIITDEGTFSSASILACHLKTLANGKIIGRPAGGSFYKGNAGTLILELPNSNLNLFINPNTFYSHLKSPQDPHQLKQPDTLLSPNFIREKDRDAFFKSHALKSFN